MAFAAGVPATPKHPATNTYFGTTVVDDYLWLENFDDPAVKAWNRAENNAARAYLDRLSARPLVAARLKKLYYDTSASYSGLQSRPGVLFATKFKPPAQQPWLVTLNSADDLASERVVLDPNQLNPKGTTAIDFAIPSHDGKLLAVSLSENGSEDGMLFVYDVATGNPLPDKIPRVQYPTGGGSVAWNADDTALYYTRYPHAGERPPEHLNFYLQVYFHRLGTPAEQDHYELGKELPRIAEIELQSSDDGRFLLATVANGDGGEFAHYLLGPEGHWKQITGFKDEIKHGTFGRDGALYLLSRAGAPHGKLLRLPLDAPDLAKARTIVPETTAVIEGFCASTKSLYVQDLVGGPSQIRVFDLANPSPRMVPTRPVSAVQQMVCTESDQVLFRNITYIAPFVWMAFDPASGKSRPTSLAGVSAADFSDTEVVREFASSKDGTKVPLNIIRRKGTKLDGKNPTLLYGYGGYGVSLSPSFSVSRRIWLDQGGVYAVANLRGGGEFGEEWHKAGNLTKKQNVFDDFAACAAYLIKAGYTQPARLAVEGRSNGGLLMGAFLSQHPDLARAVVSHVSIYDSLRTELEPNGEFNITEFGTVKDQEQFRALYAYSPYHHVTDGARYPAVLLLTGDHDGRVNPFHSRKMAARLQAANKSKHPILLRTTSSAGHGIGTALDERIAQEADVFAFLFDQLGMSYKVAPR
ncbi:MAG: S9 family peptidase [Verrucomicrobia bacterium]|nr:MAG: S9 family peptidase [Verrucomicrobiota bacterium]